MIDTEIKYKKTGLDWMPEVPEHWEVSRIKHIGNVVTGATPSSDIKEFWDGNINWITPAEFGNEMYISNSLRKITKEGLESCNTTLVPRGSVILSTRAPIGSIVVADTDLCTNQGCKSIVPANIDNLFLFYFLSIQGKALNSLGNGTTFKELSLRSLKDFKLPVPPLSEQAAIVQYIKAQEEKINLFIQKKQRFIELLKEQRQSIILNTTRAVDKSDKTIRVKYLGRIRSGDGISNENLKDEGEYEVFGGNGFIGYTNSFNTEGENIIIGRVGAKCGNIRLINERKYISDNALILTLFEKDNYEYVAMVLEALDLNKLSVSTAQPLITGTKVMNIAIPHLSTEEQNQIVSHIKTETATIDTAIAKAEREIELIKEYKEAMIAEAVMGKRK